MDLTKQQKDYLKSLRNFLNKCPLQTNIEYEGDRIKIEGSTYGVAFKVEYVWKDALNQNKKDFIYKVKTDLTQYYPTLIDHNYQTKDLSPIELAALAEKAKDITKLPSQIQETTTTITWVIDKIAVWENILILKQIPDDGNHYKYKFNKPLFLFMKKLKAGFWKTPEELGDYFFQNAQCILQDQNNAN